MIHYRIQHSATSVILRVVLYDSTATSPTLAGKTGVTSSTSGLRISITSNVSNGAAFTFTSADSKIETISTLGSYTAPTSNAYIRFAQVDSTNHPGLYELQFHNDHLAIAGATELTVTINGVTGMATTRFVIDLLGQSPSATSVDANMVAVDGEPLAAHADGYLPADSRLIAGVPLPAFDLMSGGVIIDWDAGIIYSSMMDSHIEAVQQRAVLVVDGAWYPIIVTAWTLVGGAYDIHFTHATSQTGLTSPLSAVLVLLGTPAESSAWLDTFTLGFTVVPILNWAITDTIYVHVRKSLLSANPTGWTVSWRRPDQQINFRDRVIVSVAEVEGEDELVLVVYPPFDDSKEFPDPDTLDLFILPTLSSDLAITSNALANLGYTESRLHPQITEGVLGEGE